MTADTLSMLAAGLLSILFSYVPGLNEWFAALAPAIKRLLMLGLIVVVAGLAYAEACTGLTILNLAVTCDQAGWMGLIRAVLFAIAANQSVYAVVQQPAKVRAIAAKVKLAHNPPVA